MRTERAVGVFDSGMGGLTVVSALRAALPHEHIVYLGDTARVPYGTKSAATVIRYSIQIADFLLDKGIKYLLVACNTASAHAIAELRAHANVPVMGVVEPGARRAAQTTRLGHVGVIGTLGTVESGAYQRALHALDPALAVSGQACPLLVPLAEEGWVDHPVTLEVCRHYLLQLRAASGDLDTVILGCTHYPLLRAALARVAGEVFGHPVALVDSAEEVSGAVARDLRARGLALPGPDPGQMEFWFTDVNRFSEIAPRFMGTALPPPRFADL